ncbi:MAG TPA: hypothetical protein VGF89_15020 [Steroidobacteraceae bacterium]|jgi:hypothetical protein
MRRRTFLISAGAVVCGALATRYATSRDQHAISKVLYKKLSYLKLDAMGVQRFAADMAARREISSFRLHVTDAAGMLYTDSSLSPDSRLGSAVRHGEDRIVTQYLISSDFFHFGSDRSRIVHYLGYYDPLLACSNPFARPATGPPAA